MAIRCACCEADAVVGLFCQDHADISHDLRSTSPDFERRRWWAVVGLMIFLSLIVVVVAVETQLRPGKPVPPLLRESFWDYYPLTAQWQLVIAQPGQPDVAVRDTLSSQDCEDARAYRIRQAYQQGQALQGLACREMKGHWRRIWETLAR